MNTGQRKTDNGILSLYNMTVKTRETSFKGKIVLAKRRSKYTSRGVITKLKKYLRKCIEKQETPFVEHFALLLGVSDRTLYNWSIDKEKPEFHEWYAILKTIQKLDLKRKALSGLAVSKIASLILSAEHNVVERVKREIANEDGKPFVIEQALSPEDRKRYSKKITELFNEIYSKKAKDG